MPQNVILHIWLFLCVAGLASSCRTMVKRPPKPTLQISYAHRTPSDTVTQDTVATDTTLDPVDLASLSKSPPQPIGKLTFPLPMELHEAALLAQGRGNGWLNGNLILQIATVLTQVRTVMPVLRKVRYQGRRSLMDLSLSLFKSRVAALKLRLCPAEKPGCDPETFFPLTKLGMPHLQRWAHHFGVVSASLLLDQLYLEFSGARDISKLAAIFSSLPGVETATGVLRTGDSNWIYIHRVGHNWQLLFRRGSGDCPSGCTQNTFWRVEYNYKTGVVTHRIPRNAGTSRKKWGWYAPDCNDKRVFPSGTALLKMSKSQTWWHRLGQIRCLGKVWDHPKHKDFRFGDYKGLALHRVQLAMKTGAAEKLFLWGIQSADRTIRSAAHQALCRMTLQNFGAGKQRVPQWRVAIRNRFLSSPLHKSTRLKRHAK